MSGTPIDLHDFFGKYSADMAIAREMVQPADIDNKNYVKGSQGSPKVIIIFDDAKISKYGTPKTGYTFTGNKQIIEFWYEDPLYPTTWTRMVRRSDSLGV